MAVNHFTDKAAAVRHLISKGFKQIRADLWESAVGVDARIEPAPIGVRVFFFETDPKPLQFRSAGKAPRATRRQMGTMGK